MYQADLITVAKATAIGLIVATLCFTFLLAAFRGFSLWLSPLVGIAVGEAVSIACNRKRAFALQATAAATIVAGVLLADVLLFSLRVGHISGAVAMRVIIADLLTLSILALLGVALAVSRLR